MSREKYFFDPNKLPAGEKAYYEKIRPIIEGLLNDLKKNCCLRRAEFEETKNFIILMKDKDEIGMAFNRIVELFSSSQKISKFMEQNRDYFTDQDFSYLFMSQLYFLSLVHIEMFKNFLLFYLKRGSKQKFKDKMTLGPFLLKLKKVSPVYGQLIENELDIGLRNSFAHGLFHIEVKPGTEPIFIYYDDLGKLRNPISIPIAELMKKRKNYNIIYLTLASLIAEKMEEKTFR